jgi:hypothetical protein
MNIVKVTVSMFTRFAAVLALLCSMGHSQITGNVTARVLLIRVPGEKLNTFESGTAFALDIDRRQYLITAKHLVSHLHQEGDTVQIRLAKQWSTQAVKILVCDDPVDIAVLIPSAAVVRADPLEPLNGNMTLGEDVYISLASPMANFTSMRLWAGRMVL